MLRLNRWTDCTAFLDSRKLLATLRRLALSTLTSATNYVNTSKNTGEGRPVGRIAPSVLV
jgi:hypothetical protein